MAGWTHLAGIGPPWWSQHRHILPREQGPPGRPRRLPGRPSQASQPEKHVHLGRGCGGEGSSGWKGSKEQPSHLGHSQREPGHWGAHGGRAWGSRGLRLGVGLTVLLAQPQGPKSAVSLPCPRHAPSRKCPWAAGWRPGRGQRFLLGEDPGLESRTRT